MSEAGDSIRVLHVDDDPSFTDMVATYLEREDERIKVLTATGSDDGLATLADHRVDCIVSDYDMPGQDGIQFLRAVREDYSDLPFILFTGKGSEDVAAEAIGQGVSSYLQKEGGTAQYTVLCNRIDVHVERYRTQREVARLNQEYQLVSETATDAFWVLYPDSDRLRMNGVDQFGYDDYQATLEWWLERIHPADRDRVTEHDEAMLADEAGAFDEREPGRGWFTNEYRLERADGTYAECIERGVVIFEDGDPIKVVGTTTDVTERKDRERELREKSTLLDQLFEQVPIHMYVKDREARLIRLSEYYTDDPEEHLGKTDREVFPGEHGEEAYADDMRVIETGEPVFDKEEYLPDREEWHLTSKVPWYDEDGEIKGLIGVTKNITERKQYERELERQNERLDEFASVVSHDLRNPLSVAEGRIEVARAECESEHLDSAAAAVDRSLALIEDLLTLAREGEWVSEIEAVDLGEVVDGCWRSVQTPDASLDVESDRTIRADASRLQRLLENLIRNAVEHSDDDVTVTIGDLEDGFYVADDGPGISEDERQQVFETGYSTTREGTGFGLNIVTEVAEAHGWEVSVTESAAGGARFEITGVELADD
ncbi:MAG: PAS domain-containing protein [Halobacteriales archaeon]